jgi:hypothetical protein
MILNRFVVSLLVLFSIAAMLVTAVLFRSIASHPLKHSTVAIAPAESEFSASLALEEKALALPPSSIAVTYNGQFECPLKMQSEALQPGGSSASRKGSTLTRPLLTLKGILYKSNPLAIVADASGKTSILAAGDTIAGQTISAIGKASVTFRDKHGTWNLSVKE